MRNFNTIDPSEKIIIKLSITAKQAAALQNESKKRGLTMSAYMAVYLEQLADSLSGK